MELFARDTTTSKGEEKERGPGNEVGDIIKTRFFFCKKVKTFDTNYKYFNWI